MQNADKMCIFPTPVKPEYDRDRGYIYLCKIMNYKRDTFYKIGFSRNLEQRMGNLFIEHCGQKGFVELLAYGETHTMRSTEFYMHQKFWNNYYSFVYSAGIPKWSHEYFSFDYSDVCKVIKKLRGKCFKVQTVVTPIESNEYLEFYSNAPFRLLPYCVDDLGYWEIKKLTCNNREECMGEECCNYKDCRYDIKCWYCD